MAFNKKPVTGMRDILPLEMEVRSRLTGIIRDTYSRYGFTQIETPLVEHIGNLTGKQGGENEKLIFKILKRGDNLKRGIDKLMADSTGAEIAAKENCGDRANCGDRTNCGDRSAAGSEGTIATEAGIKGVPQQLAAADPAECLTEEGLRYDLTLPLSRYYAANAAELPQPFKALQIGPVFRADRPQKGRFRQFTQCDIDILGDPTNLAEKELIAATSEALTNIGFSKYNFYIVINDRRLLFELIRYAGLPETDAEDILIVLDKLDKIGPDGVDKELTESGYDAEAVHKLRELLDGYANDADGALAFAARIGTDEARKAGESVSDIMRSVTGMKGRDIRIVFDPTLVRGMGYYTGTIFEIKTEALGSSVGGGGRYDRMIGRFTGKDVPAVGFSIGFERIMTVIMENGAEDFIADAARSAWLIEKGMPAERIAEIFDKANEERAAGKRVLIVWMAKNKKFQKENLMKQGYTDIRDFYVESLKR